MRAQEGCLSFFSLVPSLILPGFARICHLLGLSSLRSPHHSRSPLVVLSSPYLSSTTSLYKLPRFPGSCASRVSEPLYVSAFLPSLYLTTVLLYQPLLISPTVPTLGTKSRCLRRTSLASPALASRHSTVPLRAFQLRTKSSPPLPHFFLS